MSFSDSDDSIPPPPPPPPPVPHRPNSRPDSRQSESTYGGEQFELNLAELSAVPGSPLAAYAEKGTSNNKLPTAYAEKGYVHDATPRTKSPSPGGGDGSGDSSKRKKCLIIALALCVIGAGVGAALGLTLGKGSESSNNSDESSNASDNGNIEAAPGPSPESGGSSTSSKETTALKILQSNLPPESYAVIDSGEASPQNEALNWILYDDEFMDPYWDGLSQDPPDEEAEMHFMQRYVAVTLYTVLDGEDWKDNSNWKTSSNVCTWYGVNCVENRLRKKQRRNLQEAMEGAIIGLKLSNNDLQGWLPADIVALKSLENLEMHQNKIVGRLPPYLYDMVTLKSLFLDDNKIEGKLEKEIGQLVNLEKLTLSENDMWGDIPTEISNLEKLTM